jgi:hypothetical protein
MINANQEATMQLWKTALVLILGLACGVACVAVSVWGLKKTAQAKVFAYKYRDVTVEVVDDETDQPLAKAKVEVTYEDTHRIIQPEPNSAESDGKGMATVKFALKTNDLNLSVDAKGYLSASGKCDSEISTPIHCRLKKLPKITLNVPNGYVGPIRFNLPKRPDSSQKTIPHREYQLHADAAGDVKIEDVETEANYLALQKALQKSVLTAAYEADGKIPLANDEGVKDSTIALRFVAFYYSWKDPKDANQQSAGKFLEKLDTDKPQQIYVIGTAEDQRALLKSLPDAERIGVDFDFDIHDCYWGKTGYSTLGRSYSRRGGF